MSLKERALDIETKKEKLQWRKAEREFEREMRRQSPEHHKAQTAVMQLILKSLVVLLALAVPRMFYTISNKYYPLYTI